MVWQLVIAVAVLAGGVWWWNQRASRDRFGELVALCRGDDELAARLVAREARDWPAKSRAQHVARAIDALIADRQR